MSTLLALKMTVVLALFLPKVQAFGEHGRCRFRLRAEFLNLLNRHTLGGISTSPTSTTFGQVTSVSGNRTGQVTLRLDF